jgi:hypothetical protein
MNQTTPTPAPAGPTTIRPWSGEELSIAKTEYNAAFLKGDEGERLEYLRWEQWMDKQFHTERWNVDIDSESGFGELYRVMCAIADDLARERRRCEMQEERIEALVKAGEAFRAMDRGQPCMCGTKAALGEGVLCVMHEMIRNWDAAKALQGQDGAGGTN